MAKLRDDRVILYQDRDGNVYLYSDRPIELVTIDETNDGCTNINLHDKPHGPLEDILEEEELIIDDSNVIAGWDELEIRSAGNGYYIYLIDENEQDIACKGMSDGVDMVFRGDVAMTPGTIGFQLALQEWLESDKGHFLEAYFPDADELIEEHKRKLAEQEDLYGEE